MDLPLNTPTLTVEAIENHDRERQRVSDIIEVFARGFAQACGEPISDESYFVEWERHAKMIHVTFEYSDQCGGGKERIRFPVAAISSWSDASWAVDERKRQIAADKEKKREQQVRELEGELARAQSRLEALSAKA